MRSTIVALGRDLYMLAIRRVIDRCSDMSRKDLIIAASAIISMAYAGSALAYHDDDGGRRAAFQSSSVSDFSAVSRPKYRHPHVSRRRVWPHYPHYPWEADGWDFEKRFLTYSPPPTVISDSPCPMASVCRPLQLLY
jgi:hypothetical protein